MKKEKKPSDVKYGFIGPNRAREENLKKYYIIFSPNKRFISIFLAIIIGVFIIAVAKFPYGMFMSGSMGSAIGIGYPIIFMEFRMSGEGTNFFALNLIIDLIIYLILS